MIVVTVARRPLSEGTVASNVLEHGTGVLNIDASRVAGTPTTFPESRSPHAPLPGDSRSLKSQGVVAGDHISQPSSLGRWPANLVLGHLPGCRCAGSRKIRGNGDGTPGVAVRRSGVHSEAGGHQTVGAVQPRISHASPDGTETVADWDCEAGCPVAALDEQSGEPASAVGTLKYKRADTSGWKERGGSFTPGREWEAEGYGDVGGASRFFKQVQS